MALIKTWIMEFLCRHRNRYSPNDWPILDSDEGSDFIRLWLTALATRQVTEAEADKASESLAVDPPNFRREHIPMVVHAIEAARQEQGTSPGAQHGSLEAAKAALAAIGGCFGPNPEVDDGGLLRHDRGLGCGGTGLATRWHPRPDPANRIGPTLQGYCTCPMGRWLKKTHAENNPELLRCYLDLVREEAEDFWWLWMPPKDYGLDGYPYGTVHELPQWLQPKPKVVPIQKVEP